MRRAIPLLAVLVVLATVPGVVAADTRVGGRVVVESGDRVSGDVTATGGTVVVESGATVDGDLTAYAGRITVEENATVTGQLRAYGGTVVVRGTVGDNAVAYGGRITVTETGVVRGSLGAIAGRATVAGTVRGDVTGGVQVTLAPTARITGSVIYQGSLDDRGATVEEGIRKAAELSLLPTIPQPLLVLYLLLADALLGAVLLVAVPRFTWSGTNTATAEPGRTAVAGLLAAVVVALLAVVAALTVVGIPLALALLALVGVGLWVGSVLGRLALGSALIGLADPDDDHPWAALALGLVVVAALSLVPYLGPVVRLAVALLGLGVVVLGLRAAYEAVRERPGGLAAL